MKQKQNQKANKELTTFSAKVDKVFMNHSVVRHNSYTKWFAEAELSHQQVKDFCVQFSVFSNLFLIAQLKKMINAPSLKVMREAKEILATEIGVGYCSKKDHGNIGEFVTEGSIDGGKFRFNQAHFEWLLNFAQSLGLGFNDLGKRSQGTRETLFFTDKLEELIGSENVSLSAGASFAIENWAANGFWKELIHGLRKFKERLNPTLPLGFFIWHDQVEQQHAAHTQDELKELFENKDIELDQEKFIAGGIEMLDALEVFWMGLTELHQRNEQDKVLNNLSALA